MRYLVLAWKVAGLITSLVASPAAAQLEPETQTGSHIPRAPEKVGAKQTGVVIKSFASCLYRSNVTKARQLFASSDAIAIDFGRIGTTPNKISKQFDMDKCLAKQLDVDQSALGIKFSLQRLRALLLEEDYLERIKTRPPVELPESLPPRTFVALEADLPKARAIGQFADCVVERDPIGADRLIRTMPASDDERKAARTLAPALSHCLIQGQQLTLTAASVRIYAVEGLWFRYARAAPVVGK